jgi:glutathione S-transferase
MSDETQTLNRMLYAAGDLPKPETNKNHLRLYNHNGCPFSARARYSLALKNVPIQEVMICLSNKAPWHVEFNGGSVPVLETPEGVLIKDSGVVMMFAHESSNKGADLVPKDPVKAAEMRLK